MPKLHLYLPAGYALDVGSGAPTIYSRLAVAFTQAGYSVITRADSDAARHTAILDPGHAIFTMVEPPNKRALCLRRAYQYPFWRLENTNERWRFDVALARFDPRDIDPVPARTFASSWRRKLARATATHEGFIYLPLQGRLTEQRSFQFQSPLAMIETALAQDPHRKLIASLHPKEIYSIAEHQALHRLASRHPRLTIAETSAGLLEACDYVVTQNSSVAFTGYLFGKQPVLFAGADFHHIAASVPRIGIDNAFRQAKEPLRDVDRYLYWFWQIQSINAGRDDVTDQILARAARHGWPLPKPQQITPR